MRIFDKKEAKFAHFPKNFSKKSPKFLKLRSEVTTKEYSFEVDDFSVDDDYYFFFIGDFISSIPDGEYVYSITTEEDETLATGLLTIGEKPEVNKQYNNTDRHKEYNG